MASNSAKQRQVMQCHIFFSFLAKHCNHLKLTNFLVVFLNFKKKYVFFLTKSWLMQMYIMVWNIAYHIKFLYKNKVVLFTFWILFTSLITNVYFFQYLNVVFFILFSFLLIKNNLYITLESNDYSKNKYSNN